MEELITLSNQVNEALSGYIAVHNDIFKFSPRRIIPIPGLFKAIDFDSDYKQLSNCQAWLEKLFPIFDRLISSKNVLSFGKEYVSALREYALALSETISKLRDICKKLQQKSDGTFLYTKDSYNRDVDDYNVSANRYIRLGQQLNVLHTRLLFMTLEKNRNKGQEQNYI